MEKAVKVEVGEDKVANTDANIEDLLERVSSSMSSEESTTQSM
jgi:hypothetical protein